MPILVPSIRVATAGKAATSGRSACGWFHRMYHSWPRSILREYRSSAYRGRRTRTPIVTGPPLSLGSPCRTTTPHRRRMRSMIGDARYRRFRRKNIVGSHALIPGSPGRGWVELIVTYDTVRSVASVTDSRRPPESLRPASCRHCRCPQVRCTLGTNRVVTGRWGSWAGGNSAIFPLIPGDLDLPCWCTPPRRPCREEGAPGGAGDAARPRVPGHGETPHDHQEDRGARAPRSRDCVGDNARAGMHVGARHRSVTVDHGDGHRARSGRLSHPPAQLVVEGGACRASSSSSNAMVNAKCYPGTPA